ncbi:MAG: GGDEF domain-containing protein [Gammaproteobacteria bacterium]|nr:GGDEF domain-containing protein [Gammaproteobacteria bacterium]
MAGETTRVRSLLGNAEFVYAACLFAVAVVTVSVATRAIDDPFAGQSPALALFFLLFGLFTISTGYHTSSGTHVSFDRVAQISCILVLGPVAAAWVNGLASLVYPWHRIAGGRPWPQVLGASLHNAGLMALLSLVAGSLYLWAGGQVPLLMLDASVLPALLLLLVTMQLLNDLAMLLDSWISGGKLYWPFNGFVITVEGASALAALLVALIFNRMELPIVVLMLVVLATGLLALTQFARMRTHLEELVHERTRRLREQADELERQATRDQLTSLYNRRFADRFLEEGVRDFIRQGRAFAIALIDLDHFKRINDHHSHQVGDEVLCRVASLLLENCRGTDMVARFGGEEFLICFPNTDLARAASACEHLRAALEHTDWSDIAPGLAVTLCAGVAQMRPGFDRGRLLREADQRLYAAKHGGRNRVEVDLAS